MNKKLREILDSCPFIIDYTGEKLGEAITNNVIISSDLEEGLVHEMCHLVEIPKNRMFLPYFGMKNNSTSSNYNDVLREIRVHCYQYNLCQEIGMHYIISSRQWGLKFVKGFKFVPGNSDNEKYAFLDEYINNIINNYPTLLFFKEWNEKSEIVRNLNK